MVAWEGRMAGRGWVLGDDPLGAAGPGEHAGASTRATTSVTSTPSGPLSLLPAAATASPALLSHDGIRPHRHHRSRRLGHHLPRTPALSRLVLISPPHPPLPTTITQSRTQLTSEIVTRDKDIQSRFGYFRHNDFVGKPWGTKLASSNGRGFVYLLKPTPELWSVAAPCPLCCLRSGTVPSQDGCGGSTLTSSRWPSPQDSSPPAPHSDPLPPRHRLHHLVPRHQARQPRHRSRSVSSRFRSSVPSATADRPMRARRDRLGLVLALARTNSRQGGQGPQL